MDIINLLQDHRIPYQPGGGHRHVRPGWVGIDCPQCSPGAGKWKLGINLSSLAASCWTCGVSRLDEILGIVLSLDSQEARKIARLLRGNRSYNPSVKPGRPVKAQTPPTAGGLHSV